MKLSVYGSPRSRRAAVERVADRWRRWVDADVVLIQVVWRAINPESRETVVDMAASAGSEAALRLIAEITHCPEVGVVWAGDSSHPCRKIVETQSSDPDRFQVPEPWAGHLHLAPILMISSNPSISELEPYPTWDAAESDRVDFFDSRFGDGPLQVRDGVFHPLTQPRPDGSWHSPRKVAFWRDCKSNVEFLLGRPADPGVDYVMTEVVHCKSRAERGVGKAIDLCAQRWLGRVLEISPAPVVVILGDRARVALSEQLGIELPLWEVVEADLGGRKRLILAARHPNFHGPRRWRDLLSVQNLGRLHTALAIRTESIGAQIDPPVGRRSGAAASRGATSAFAEPIERALRVVRDVEVERHDGVPVALRDRRTWRVFARLDDARLTLSLARGEAVRVPQSRGAVPHATGGPQQDVTFDMGRMTEAELDRLLALILRARYTLDRPARRPLTVYDLIDDFIQQARFQNRQDDDASKNYWHQRVRALCILFGLTAQKARSGSHDQLDVRYAVMAIEDVQRSLGVSVNPFRGFSEIPADLARVLRRHMPAFDELEQARLDRSRAAVLDLLLAVDSEVDGRVVSSEDLAQLGVSPRPPVEPDPDEWL